MQCNKCESTVKMRCLYSVPVSNRLRYRNYKCLSCGNYDESVEMSLVRMNKLTPEDIKEINSLATVNGRERRFLAMKARRTHR
jgi:hypothetical protein